LCLSIFRHVSMHTASSEDCGLREARSLTIALEETAEAHTLGKIAMETGMDSVDPLKCVANRGGVSAFGLNQPLKQRKTLTTLRRTMPMPLNHIILLPLVSGAAYSLARSLGIFAGIHVPFRAPAKRVRSRRTTVP